MPSLCSCGLPAVPVRSVSTLLDASALSSYRGLRGLGFNPTLALQIRLRFAYVANLTSTGLDGLFLGPTR